MQLYYHKLRFIEIITSNWAVILSSLFNINNFFFKSILIPFGNHNTWMKYVMAHCGWKNTKHLRSLVKMLLLYNFPVEYTFWQIDKLCIIITIWVRSFTLYFTCVLCFKGTKIALGFFRIKFGSHILLYFIFQFNLF